MAPSVQRTDPPYMQVVAQIRDQIRSGQLREGDRVPSARQIVHDWGISLATATKVLAALRSEGLVQGVPGIGTVVTTAHGDGPNDWLTLMRQTGRIYPPDGHAVIKAAEVVDAPEQVADALGLEVGAKVIRRERTTYRGEQPVSTSVSWFDGTLTEIAPRLLATDRIQEGTARYIETVTGRKAVAGRDQIGARAATEQDAEDLAIPVGSPVLHGRNWYYDTNGIVVEYGEYASPGDRLRSYEYLIEG